MKSRQLCKLGLGIIMQIRLRAMKTRIPLVQDVCGDGEAEGGVLRQNAGMERLRVFWEGFWEVFWEGGVLR